jgi:hypothetical protein
VFRNPLLEFPLEGQVEERAGVEVKSGNDRQGAEGVLGRIAAGVVGEAVGEAEEDQVARGLVADRGEEALLVADGLIIRIEVAKNGIR